MDITKPFKAIKEAVKGKIEEKQSTDAQQAKLQEWKKKLNEALTEHEPFRSDCATNDALYRGTKAVAPQDSNVYMSDRYGDEGQTKDARQVVNIVFQLIESQIDPNTPLPAVEPQEEEDGDKKDMIEGKLAYMASDLSMRRMNSENERIAKKNSLAVFKVGYDPDYSKSHKSKGRIVTTNPHPMNVIPQPGVFRVKDMDYIFHLENRTIDQVCRVYGEEWRDKLTDESLEFQFLDSFSSSTTSISDKKGRVSVVECWYKDKDSDVSLMTWVNDVVIRDEAKFFYRRGEDGKPIMTESIDTEQGTVEVESRVPDGFPFVIWYNIPQEKKYAGISDPSIIFDQQEGIKKVLSIEEEKQVKGTTKIFVRKNSGAAGKITDATLQIIETEDPLSDVVTKDLKTPDNSLKDLYMIYLQAAKDALGITEASQGRTDGGANMSGRALEQLANQTAGRLAVKAEEKDIAYTELYRLWYDFLLAYSDEPTAYRTKGDDGNPKFGYFDKGKLVKQDDAGEWYYPDFDLYVQADTGLPKDKRFILDLANNAGQRIDNVEYWTLMESIGVPSATTILDMEREKMQQPPPQQPMPAQQPPGMMDQALALIKQLPPEQQAQMQQLLQTNPEQAMQMIQQAMQGGGQIG